MNSNIIQQLWVNILPRKSIAKGKNLGIKYEENINKILKDKELQLISTSSAGASDAPDGYFWYNQKRFPIEIKPVSEVFCKAPVSLEHKRSRRRIKI